MTVPVTSAHAMSFGTGRLYGREDILACNPDALLADFSDVEKVMETLADL